LTNSVEGNPAPEENSYEMTPLETLTPPPKVLENQYGKFLVEKGYDMHYETAATHGLVSS